MNNLISSVTKIIFLDLVRVSSIAVLQNPQLNKNNNTENLTVMSVLYFYDFVLDQREKLNGSIEDKEMKNKQGTLF